MEAEAAASTEKLKKDECYSEVSLGGRKFFECHICHRRISSKRNVLYHLYSNHGKSPMKRVKKQYMDDPSIQIPRTTLRRKVFQSSPMSLDCCIDTDDTVNDTLDHNSESKAFDHNSESNPFDHNSQSNTLDHNLESNHLEHNLENTMYHQDNITYHINNILDTEETSIDMIDTCVLERSIHNSEAENDDDTHSSISYSSTDISNVSSDSDSDVSDEQEISSNYDNESESTQYMGRDTVEMSMLACFLRNNISGSASKDILDTFKSLFADCEDLQMVHYENLWKYLDSDYAEEFHYCERCYEIYPDDKNVTNCRSCQGLRYRTLNKVLQPRASFVMANIKRQLKNLLQSRGIWEDIVKNKELIRKRHLENIDIITDITDGAVYKKMLSENEFLHGENNTNLTAVINTDGLSLYSSSKVQLWPIYLAVNELNPCLRFSRENIILCGVWQGKGKPPFESYVGKFSDLMNELFDEGISVVVYGKETNVKLKVICGVYDLPAKASILNMTQYNGSESCIACEEPGLTVKQGKGTSRCFPYRSQEEKYKNRCHEDVKQAMTRATTNRRVKGFKGVSSLLELKSFDIVSGSPPDYMHGVLLGVVKTLMYKWFSATEKKNSYFIGDKLALITKRLNAIQPPETMERLPRNLEKNYSNFKATELQAWLLYYAIPCLDGILPNKFLEHFALMGEGVYLLLKDEISLYDIERARVVLLEFLKNFTVLYPAGSCGLNVHNIGYHLAEYVHLLGPIWCWSCFPFEDCNSMILKTVHGTGNVTKQVMKVKEAEILIRNKLQLNSKGKTWKNLKPATNCQIAGAVVDLPNDESRKVIYEHFGLTENDDASVIKKVERVLVNGRKLYSSSYGRMRRRICYIFLTKTEIAYSVKYFILHLPSQLVFALGIPIYMSEWSIGEMHAGKYLLTCNTGDRCQLLLVNELLDNLWYIDTKEDSGKVFVTKMPNPYGHAVFK